MSYGLVTNDGWIGNRLNELAICIGTVDPCLRDVCPRRDGIRVIGWPCIRLAIDHFADADSCDQALAG